MEFPTKRWDFAPTRAQGRNATRSRALIPMKEDTERTDMVKNIITAVAGKKVAEKMGGGTLGMAAATALPFIARRGLGPLGLALGAGWAAKKLYDKRQAARTPTYPSDAAPATVVVK